MRLGRCKFVTFAGVADFKASFKAWRACSENSLPTRVNMRQRSCVARIPPLAIEPLFGFKCVTVLQVFHGVEGREELPEESARLLGAGCGSPVACHTITYHMSHVTCHMSHNHMSYNDMSLLLSFWVQITQELQQGRNKVSDM